MNKIADVLETIREIVYIAVSFILEKKKGLCKPPVPPQDILNFMPMQTYFGMLDRIAEGPLKMFREKLDISSELSYKTNERGYDPERTAQTGSGTLMMLP